MKSRTYADISRDQSGLERGYYVYLQNGKFLHNDLVVRSGVVFNGEANGFWKTRGLAQQALEQYVNKEKLFERAG